MDKVTIKQLPEREQYKVLMDLISAATEDVKRWVVDLDPKCEEVRKERGDLARRGKQWRH